jgi:hypothetical protein
MSGLYADQLATRALPRSPGWVLRSVLRRLSSLALELLPWVVLLAASGRALVGASRRHPGPVRFGLGWTALLVMLSAVPVFTRPRYTAPALPILAVVCSLLLVTLARDPAGARRLRLVARGVLLLVGLAGLVLAFVGTAIAPAWIVAGTLIVTAAALAACAGGGLLPLVALGLVLILAGGILQVLVRPLVAESPARALTACLSALGPDGTTAVLVGKLNGLAADLRLVSGGRLRVETVPNLATLQARDAGTRVVVAPEGIARRLETAGWPLEPCGRELRGQRWTVRDYWRLARARDLDAVRAEQGRRFYVVRRAPP